MKKGIVLLTLAILLASFALVGGVSADESAPHLCVYTGVGVGPGVAVTVDYYDVNGVLIYTVSLDNLNGTDIVFNDQEVAYLPVVSGTVSLNVTFSGYPSFQFTIPANELGNGECFDDF